MTFPVVLTPVAQAEFDEAHDWYESRRVGLGADFSARVRSVLDRIAADPLFYPEVFSEVRQAPVRKRPYTVLYLPEPTRVAVIAVFHTSRDPAVWQGRV